MSWKCPDCGYIASEGECSSCGAIFSEPTICSCGVDTCCCSNCGGSRHVSYYKQERQRRREEQRRIEKEAQYQAKQSEYEDKFQQVRQLQSDLTQKEQVIKQRRETYKRITLDIAARKSKLERTSHDLKSTQESLIQERQICTDLTQKQKDIQHSIEKASEELLAFEESIFLGRGHHLTFHTAAAFVQNSTRFDAETSRPCFAPSPTPETYLLKPYQSHSYPYEGHTPESYFLNTGRQLCTDVACDPNSEEFFARRREAVLDAHTTHDASSGIWLDDDTRKFLERGAEFVAEQAIDYSIECGVTKVLGHAAGKAFGFASMLLSFQDCGSEEEDRFMAALHGEVARKEHHEKQVQDREKLDQMRQDLKQLHDRQKTNEAKFQNKRSAVSKLETQCTTLEQSITQARQQISSIEQQRKEEQDRISTLDSQKDSLQARLNAEQRQLLSLDSEVRDAAFSRRYM